MMKQEILIEFDATNNGLWQLISSVKDDLFNTAPFNGSWTPAQLVKHLHQSDSMLLKTLTGPARPTTRAIDEYVPGIRAAFLDFSTKMASPAAIVPGYKIYNKQLLVKDLRDSREQIRKIIENDDLRATCLFVEVKELGTPTRLELIHFIIVHTQRHIHQLKNMIKILAGESI